MFLSKGLDSALVSYVDSAEDLALDYKIQINLDFQVH